MRTTQDDRQTLDLSDVELQKIAKLVYRTTGIVLDDSKRALIVGRLSKRVRARGASSFRAYLQLVGEENPDPTELRHLINCITTNKTSFFREAHHFDYLKKSLERRKERALDTPSLRRVRIWSAGCSTGEEPYSIAMTVADALGNDLSSWDVKILATDIDTNVLSTAEKGVYAQDPTGLPGGASRYFTPQKRERGVVWEIRPELRDLIAFRQLNFVDDHWPIQGPFDYLFCRNVTIYFDRSTQEKLYRRFATLLHKEGSFFAGHSENLSWFADSFSLVSNTVYVHTKSATGASSAAKGSVPPPSSAGRVASAEEPKNRAKETPPSEWVRSARPWGNMPEVAIQAGGVHASKTPVLIKTTLGSCVAVCLFDPIAQVGGMNHFMLPGNSSDGESPRWGVQAMELLINQLHKLGADRRRLVAKIAGGCTVVDVELAQGSIADRNVRFIEAFLAAEGFPLLSKRVGGTKGVEVRFRTDTGAAFVRALGDQDTRRAIREAKQYERSLTVAQPTRTHEDDVIWFR